MSASRMQRDGEVELSSASDSAPNPCPETFTLRVLGKRFLRAQRRLFLQGFADWEGRNAPCRVDLSIRNITSSEDEVGGAATGTTQQPYSSIQRGDVVEVRNAVFRRLFVPGKQEGEAAGPSDAGSCSFSKEEERGDHTTATWDVDVDAGTAVEGASSNAGNHVGKRNAVGSRPCLEMLEKWTEQFQVGAAAATCKDSSVKESRGVSVSSPCSKAARSPTPMFHPPALEIQSCFASSNSKVDRVRGINSSSKAAAEENYSSRPACILQCLGGTAERLLEFLSSRTAQAEAGVFLAQQLNQDRLIYLTRDNWFFRSCLRPAAEAAAAARVGEKDANFDFSAVELETNFLLRKEFGFPSFLCSVVRRVYYLSEDIGPVVSLRDAKKRLENFYQMNQKRTCIREVRDSHSGTTSSSEGVQQQVQEQDEVGTEEVDGILAFPRNLENELCEQFNKRHGGAGRRVGVVVFADGLFWLGLGAHVWNFPIPERENLTAPCSAAWKLREVFQRGLLPLCQGSEDEEVALDVGAAPGGWSWFLAEEQLLWSSSSPGQEDVLELGSSPVGRINCGSFHSIAVDPAELDPEVRTHHNVTHCQMKAEDFLDAVAVDACSASSEPSRASSVAVARARTALEKGNGYALYVCDANCEPEKAVELLERSRVVARSERTHGKQTSYFVLTIKIRESATRFAKRKPFLLERLRALSGGKMREVHLFANTKHELTVLGKIMPISRNIRGDKDRERQAAIGGA